MAFARHYLLLLTLLAVPVLAAAQTYERYALVLNDPSVGEFSQSHKNAPKTVAESHRQQIMAAQNSLRSELGRRNLTMTGSVQNVLNAVFVRITPDRAAELRSLPGVKGVVRMRRMRPKLDRAAVLVNAQGAWNALGGDQKAGLGMKIAIIDSGIDQNHPAFRDNTLAIPSGFPKCAPADCSFTNHKVIVARSYVQPLSPPDPATSRPDDYSPRDHVGHGTAVAMAAAGERNTGPADTIEGIAPKAYLGSYKVFGSPGVNDGAYDDQIISALEDALNDGMNVAVLSLGGPALSGPLDVGPACGLTGDTPCDPEAIAIENATKAGLLVVAAGGNEGDTGLQLPTMGTVDSPGHAPSAIAVGATTNSHFWVPGVRVSGSGVPSSIQKIEGQFGDGPEPYWETTAPLRDVSAVSSDAFGCSALPAGSLNGDYVLVERGNCNFVVKVTNAQNAGAAGVIFWDPSADTQDTPSGLSNTLIPAVLIGVTGGQPLKTFIDAHPGFPVTMDPFVLPVDTADFNTVVEFSSRGPSITGAIKPDVAAVGTDLYLAAGSYDPNGVLYSPDGYTVSNGTSFSTPIVAGAAALVKQKHPGFGPLDIKSAIVNTAGQQLTDESGTARVTAVGGGLLDAGAALAATVTVNPATVSFGILKSSSSLPARQQLQFTNGGSSTVTLALSISQRDSDTKAHVALDKTSLTLTPGQSDFATATLSGTLPDAGEYDGAIIVQGGGNTLRVPYLYMRGDGVAFNIFALLGDGDDCTVNQGIPDGAVVFKVVDDFGVPVAGLPVHFAVTQGGGSITQPDTQTDANGIAGAVATCGPNPVAGKFTGEAGGLTVPFSVFGRLLPVIAPNGAVNAASFQVGPGVAPGSYITLFGSGLSDYTDTAFTASLPLSIDSASVSFDVPSANLSLPGRLYYVSPGQVNVQVPWELQGQSSVLIKVTIEDTQGPVYTLPLAAFSPAFFTYTESGTARLLLAALDSANRVVTSANPAQPGQIVQLYANGLGPVDHQPATGEPVPLSPLAHTLTEPTVTIAGQAATVKFSGLAPLYSGLYQVNVEVPAGTPAGVQPVVLKINGVDSPAANLPVK